jgi:hypothetical protein
MSPCNHPTVAMQPTHRRHAHNTAAQPVKENISQIKKIASRKQSQRIKYFQKPLTVNIFEHVMLITICGSM